LASERSAIRDEVLALKRERILEEARSLFYERGYQGATLDAVAARLNVTKPFIYAYFENKAELLGEICQRGTKGTLDAVQEALRRSGRPRERLDFFIREMSRVVVDHQANVTIYFREEKHVPPETAAKIDAWREQIDHALTTLLKEGVAASEFEIEDVALASLAIGGLVTWMFTWYRPHGRLSPEQLAAGMSGLVRKLVGTRS
jgi:AcrR family transcriptional regulator